MNALSASHARPDSTRKERGEHHSTIVVRAGEKTAAAARSGSAARGSSVGKGENHSTVWAAASRITSGAIQNLGAMLSLICGFTIDDFRGVGRFIPAEVEFDLGGWER